MRFGFPKHEIFASYSNQMHFMLETLVPKDKAGLDRSSDKALLVSEVSKQRIKKNLLLLSKKKPVSSGSNGLI